MRRKMEKDLKNSSRNKSPPVDCLYDHAHYPLNNESNVQLQALDYLPTYKK